MNVARNSALWAGCPVSTSGTTINRFCSSGLQAIASIAHSIVHDKVTCGVGGGVDSISLVQPKIIKGAVPERVLLKKYPALWMPMIETADIVAARYGVSRERQDAYSVESQRRTAAAQLAGLFAEEIVPMDTKMQVKDKQTGEVSWKDYTVVKDECNRPGTSLDDLRALAPIRFDVDPLATITAGNASQLSDGASACVLMEEKEAERLGLTPLGAFVGFAVGGCSPEEMGIGPTVAVPKLLARYNLTVDDIDLWELNEAFAVVPLHCADVLGIDHNKMNVNGGSISIGHPFGMTGSAHWWRCVWAGACLRYSDDVARVCVFALF